VWILTKRKPSHKIIAFTSDNCNTKFGGDELGNKNVFTILINILKTNIFGIDCAAAHILYNVIQTSTGIITIDS